jgi:hypothetical protein
MSNNINTLKDIFPMVLKNIQILKESILPPHNCVRNRTKTFVADASLSLHKTLVADASLSLHKTLVTAVSLTLHKTIAERS